MTEYTSPPVCGRAQRVKELLPGVSSLNQISLNSKQFHVQKSTGMLFWVWLLIKCLCLLKLGFWGCTLSEQSLNHFR